MWESLLYAQVISYEQYTGAVVQHSFLIQKWLPILILIPDTVDQ